MVTWTSAAHVLRTVLVELVLATSIVDGSIARCIVQEGDGILSILLFRVELFRRRLRGHGAPVAVPLRVVLDSITREVFRAIAVARAQLGRLLLAIENGQTVVAAVRALVSVEQAATVHAVVLHGRAAQWIGTAYPSGRTATDDRVLGHGRVDCIATHFDALLGLLTELGPFALAVDELFAFFRRYEADQCSLAARMTSIGAARDQVGALDHVAVQRIATPQSATIRRENKITSAARIPTNSC